MTPRTKAGLSASACPWGRVRLADALHGYADLANARVEGVPCGAVSCGDRRERQADSGYLDAFRRLVGIGTGLGQVDTIRRHNDRPVALSPPALATGLELGDLGGGGAPGVGALSADPTTSRTASVRLGSMSSS
jgi:hypothetical protein